MTAEPITPEEREALAAELALGVLDGEDLAGARRLARDDAGFGRDVGRWSGRLAAMLDEVAPAEPPQQAWSNIERRIGSQAESAPPESASNVVLLRKRVGRWQGIAAGAMALAASLALVLVTRPPQTVTVAPAEQRAPDPLVAMLADDGDDMKLVASWDPGSRRLIVAASDMAAEPGHSHELWVIPSDGTPRSLGTMPSSPRALMQLTEAVSGQLQRGATLAVSVEPAGGSPTGLPTGPVIASGKLEPA